MTTFLIFVTIWGAMIAMSFWAAYVEGRNAWDRGKLGWKIQITKKYSIPAFEFYIFVIMCPLFLSLPFVVYGWNLKLFGILISAYLTGIILEDFLWFIVNPKTSIKDFNSKFADYYPWIKIGKIEVPLGYIAGILVALLSWYFIWK